MIMERSVGPKDRGIYLFTCLERYGVERYVEEQATSRDFKPL